MRWRAEPTPRPAPRAPSPRPAGSRSVPGGRAGGPGRPRALRASFPSSRSSVCLSSISHSAFMRLSVSLFHFQISISFSPLFSSLAGLSFPLFSPAHLLPQVAASLSPTSCSSHNSYLSLEENREGGLYTLEIAFKLKTTTTISTSRSCRPLPVVGHGNVPA